MTFAASAEVVFYCRARPSRSALTVSRRQRVVLRYEPVEAVVSSTITKTAYPAIDRSSGRIFDHHLRVLIRIGCYHGLVVLVYKLRGKAGCGSSYNIHEPDSPLTIEDNTKPISQLTLRRVGFQTYPLEGVI